MWKKSLFGGSQPLLSLLPFDSGILTEIVFKKGGPFTQTFSSMWFSVFEQGRLPLETGVYIFKCKKMFSRPGKVLELIKWFGELLKLQK